MALLVQKFGGTAVADPKRFRDVAARIARGFRGGDEIVVALSAMGDETDELLALVPEVADLPSRRELDVLITAGERKAVALLCMALQDQGVPAISLSGSQAGIVTDCTHTDARILHVQSARVRQCLAQRCVPVVAGAQGLSVDGNVTFLGRGGTDTTAVALAAALSADACELYTDVPGILTADPALVPDARLLKRISFEEMLEISRLGSPKPALQAADLAARSRIPLHIRSAFSEEDGTWIGEATTTSPGRVTAVIVGPGPLVATGQTAEEGASSTSELASIALIGRELAAGSEIVAKATHALRARGIELLGITSGELHLSCAVPAADVAAAARTLHAAFELGDGGEAAGNGTGPDPRDAVSSVLSEDDQSQRPAEATLG